MRSRSGRSEDEQWLLFTDMDGTLLNHHDYSYEPAKPVMAALEKAGIPVHIASSKTFAESINYYREWQLSRPLVIENGACVALPAGDCDKDWGPHRDGYRIRALSADYATIRDALEELRSRHNWRVSGFGDWSASKVAKLTGLTTLQADLARQRQGTEPVLWDSPDELVPAFEAGLRERGLRLLRGGRFLHIMGQADKATGVETVMDWYRARGMDSPRCLCLGDSDNDRTMLEQADCAIVVQKPDGSHLNLRRDGDVHYSKAPAPKGWADSVRVWLDS